VLSLPKKLKLVLYGGFTIRVFASHSIENSVTPINISLKMFLKLVK